jgi:TolB-like protein/Flp pilus assembly protein TadD
MSLFSELKRRNVFRVAIAYLAAAWLLSEVATTLFPLFGLGEAPARAVVTLLAIGFPLFLIFSWVFEITPEGLKLEKDIDRSVSITRKTGKRLDRIIIVLLALALGYFAFDKFVLQPVRDADLVEETAQQARSDALVESYGDQSIAVLPFINMSADPEQDYFSDGISEELLNLLARIPELRVISRSSAFSFKGKDIVVPEVAKQLNVAHVLEGSVRKAGNRIRVTAQLIEARSDTHLWSDTYDRELDDIFAIQDEIAGAVVDALKLTLLGEAPQTEPINSEAYMLYLQARHIGDHLTADAVERSNALLKQVLAIAPDYARAWRLLARNYAVQVDKNLLPREEGNALVREAITQALAIDPGLAEAHSWLAMWELGNDGDLAAAAQRLQRAISLERGNFIVISHVASFLSRLGRLDEAIAIHEYQLTLDPLNPITNYNLARRYMVTGQPDKAIAKIRSLQMLSPDNDWAYWVLCWALLFKGEYSAALQAIQQDSNENYRLYGEITVYHAMGQASKADSVLKEYIEKYGQDSPYSVASLLAHCGEIERSFAWLEKASSHTSPPSWIVEKMWFANLHDDPRWLPFLESIGRAPEQLSAIDFEVTLPE